MKVGKLLQLLQKVDPESEVILQKDAEGNSFSPLSDASMDVVYVPDTTYSGQAYWLSWSAEDADMSEEDWAEIQRQPRCVLLIPVN